MSRVKTIADHFPDETAFVKALDLAKEHSKFQWQAERFRRLSFDFSEEGMEALLTDPGYEVLIDLAYGEVDC